ncbi:tripartite motif-containing protein 2-like [Ptychodera flava]|uniref:tripartite motif-containing protein 2-like n=1 Tax=Ptychodera flava TaxID=63121 RepID=UPI00396A8DE9
MHHGNAAQLLFTKGDVNTRIKQLITMETTRQAEYNDFIFRPREELSQHGILGILESQYDIEISKCTVENIPKQLLKGDSADLLITTRDSTGKQVIPKQQVKAKVRKPDASWEDINVADNRDGTHNARVRGQVDGQYQVTMTIGNQPMPGCPVIIPVIKGLLIGSQGSAEGYFNNPFSVAINKDRGIVTADRDNNRLQITTRRGKVKKSLAFKQFKKPFKPSAIAVSSDNTYYNLDTGNKQVVVSGEKGHVIRCFGQNELNDPYSIGISPVDGHVYVTDYGGKCVRVYSQHGKYLKSFGSYGKGQGRLNCPWGVVISSNGTVFIADYYDQCIQVFNAHDQYLYSFDCQTGDCKRRHPTGIAIENDKYVYVTTNFPSSLLKFESSGRFVCRIDSDSDGLNCPSGIALTDDVPCRVVVADTKNHCIKVFVQ